MRKGLTRKNLVKFIRAEYFKIYRTLYKEGYDESDIDSLDETYFYYKGKMAGLREVLYKCGERLFTTEVFTKGVAKYERCPDD